MCDFSKRMEACLIMKHSIDCNKSHLHVLREGRVQGRGAESLQVPRPRRSFTLSDVCQGHWDLTFDLPRLSEPLPIPLCFAAGLNRGGAEQLPSSVKLSFQVVPSLPAACANTSSPLEPDYIRWGPCINFPASRQGLPLSVASPLTDIGSSYLI